MNNALIIFIKNPEEGNVKTRLAKTVGKEKALDIYKTLLHHTNTVVRNVHADKFVFYSSFINENDDWENSIFKKYLQNGNDLGLKMFSAFENIFAEGYKNVCIIGSDCPQLTAGIIHQCFIEINKADVVVGPAKDGGYYLLCIKKLHAEIFKNISWSTEVVLNETIAACKQLHLSYFLMRELNDIDTEEDWNEFNKGISPVKNIL